MVSEHHCIRYDISIIDKGRDSIYLVISIPRFSIISVYGTHTVMFYLNSDLLFSFNIRYIYRLTLLATNACIHLVCIISGFACRHNVADYADI